MSTPKKRGLGRGLDALLGPKGAVTPVSVAAVAEPQPAPEPGPGALLAQELALDARLRGLARGRLEQEFLNPARVAQALTGWAA